MRPVRRLPRRLGGEVDRIAADLTVRDGLSLIVDSVTEKFGVPDIVANVAGLNLREPFEEVSEKTWDETININLSVPFFLSRLCISGMVAKGGGNIINVGSLQSYRAFPNSMPYGAAKGGVIQLTRAMAQAWSGKGVTANAIMPGFFPTHLTKPVFADPELVAHHTRMTPAGRLGRMEDLDGITVFLASAGSRYITRSGPSRSMAVIRPTRSGAMKALVYTGAKSLEFKDEPEPVAGNSDVLVAIEAVGICGSDMHAYLGHDERRPAPLILGHEASGRALTGRYEGRRVVINPLVSCGRCRCLVSAGARTFAANARSSACRPDQGHLRNASPFPKRISCPCPTACPPGKRALAEPIATGYHAVAKAIRALARPVAECRILVFGGGAVGLSAALVAAAQGGRDIWLAETNPVRRRTVEATTDFTVVDPIARDIGPKRVRSHHRCGRWRANPEGGQQGNSPRRRHHSYRIRRTVILDWISEN